MSLCHAESPDSHVVYCRLTKEREVKTVTPVPWMWCHNTTAGTQQEFQSSESERARERAWHRGGEMEKEKKNRGQGGRLRGRDTSPCLSSLSNRIQK